MSGCRASKYGVSRGKAKRRDRRCARQAARSASRARGSTTHNSSVAASRWIQGAALACAGAPGASRSGPMSGTAMPVSALAGASNSASTACTVAGSAKVLCQPAR